MGAALSEQQRQLLAELEGLPEEYYPLLLQIIRAYCDSVLLKPAADAFRQGWQEALNGKMSPLVRLWEGIEGDLPVSRSS
jgi:hypothetical protein